MDTSNNTKEEEESLDDLLEKEKKYTKTEGWNKLHYNTKIEKLHSFSETYGKKHNLSIAEVKKLKTYFSKSLQDKKLSKTKDVNYDKSKQEVIDVPGLLYVSTTHSFTIRNETKRPSVLKSLTPRRTTAKEKPPKDT